jgi:hypothetical protein
MMSVIISFSFFLFKFASVTLVEEEEEEKALRPFQYCFMVRACIASIVLDYSSSRVSRGRREHQEGHGSMMRAP